MSDTTNLTVKATAMEIVLIALMRDKRDDPEFWDCVEQIRSVVWTAPDARQAAGGPAILERIETVLDEWRDMAGPEGRPRCDPSDD